MLDFNQESFIMGLLMGRLSLAQERLAEDDLISEALLRETSSESLLSKPKKIVAVGHRGTKKFAPENTLIAHEIAYALGARAIEFDIRCTRDGEFVVIHDGTVNRTTNGTGRVKDMTLKQIKALDAGGYKGPAFSGETIPTLREALRNVRGRFVVDIDFKGGPKNSADKLAQVLEEEWKDEYPLLTIFARFHHFNMLKPLAPKYALRPHYFSQRRVRHITENYPLEIMGLRRRSFSHKVARAIRQSGLHLFCNVMGRYDNLIGFQDSVDAGALFIQSDHLDNLVPYLTQKGLLQTGVLGRNYGLQSQALYVT